MAAMSAICWIRIDDRLIHGQVTVAWRQYLSYDRIWIVDDQVGSDPFLKEVLRVAAPDGVGVEVYTTEEAIATWVRFTEGETGSRGSATPRKILLLLKRPQIALALFEEGLAAPILERGLNVGNLASRPGSKRAFKSISLGAEDMSTLDALAERGVRITFQAVPHSKQVDWGGIRAGLVKDG
jgi:PTS system mannose-specific IIB component